MEKVSKELHDKLFNLRMKLTFAKMNNEDVLELEKQIKQVRKEIALEANKKLDECEKKGK